MSQVKTISLEMSIEEKKLFETFKKQREKVYVARAKNKLIWALAKELNLKEKLTPEMIAQTVSNMKVKK